MGGGLFLEEGRGLQGGSVQSGRGAEAQERRGGGSEGQNWKGPTLGLAISQSNKQNI